MKPGLLLAGLAAVVALVLVIVLVDPPAGRIASAPAAATSRAAAPEPADSATGRPTPLAEAPDEAEPERRAAAVATEVVKTDAAVIEGRVVDALGNGLAGISIESCDASGTADEEPALTETDEVGGFHLAHAAAMRPTHARFESDEFAPRVVAVPDTGPWEVVLQARPVIEGVVYDESGAPVSPPGRVEVRVLGDGATTEEQFHTTLRSDGSYRLRGLPSGRLKRIWARAKGYDVHEAELDRALPAGDRQTHDVILERGLVVRGVVLVEETREPAPFAKVWGEGFDYEEDSYRPTTIADAAGRFRLEGFERNDITFDDVTLNTFQIVAASETHASSPLAFVALTPEPDGEFEVELLIEPRSGGVRGVVLRPDGQTPCEGALIWSIDAQTNYTFQTTNARGEFEFEDLPAGPLALMIYRTSRNADGLYESLLVELEVGGQPASDLRLVLESSAGTELSGRILDDQGAPVAGHEIAAKYQFHFGGMTMGLDSEVTVTDADGRYRFADTRAGLYTLEPADCTWPRSFELTLAQLEHREVDFRAGPCLTVSGWIELVDTPASEFEVRLFDLDGLMIKQATVFEDGTFQVTDVLARSGEVILFHDGQRIDRAPVDAASPTGIVLRVP